MILRPMHDMECEDFDNLSKTNYPKFESPDFRNGYIDKFVVHDDGIPIIGGGIRKVGEVILATNLMQSNIKQGRALIHTLGHCINVAKREELEFLYVFCDDSLYEGHLIQHGFNRVEGHALSLWVKNGR